MISNTDLVSPLHYWPPAPPAKVLPFSVGVRTDNTAGSGTPYGASLTYQQLPCWVITPMWEVVFTTHMWEVVCTTHMWEVAFNSCWSNKYSSWWLILNRTQDSPSVRPLSVCVSCSNHSRWILNGALTNTKSSNKGNRHCADLRYGG